MKLVKSYTGIIGGNSDKIAYIHHNLCVLDDLSWFAYNLGCKFGKRRWWSYHMKLWRECRKFFPELNSKVIMNFLRFHFTTPSWKSKPKKPPKASILIDYQSFSLQINPNTKLTSLWLRIYRKNYPIFGKYLLSKLENLKEVKLIQIYERNGKLYCKFSVTKTLVDTPSSNTSLDKIIGLDVNTRMMVLSNNDFYKTNRLYHRKIEHHKHNQTKRSVQNYTKDQLHKLTTNIANDLQENGLKVLVLENLRNIRRSSSKKLGTGKGKKLNYVLNSFPFFLFQNLLEYKCLDRGIDVVKVSAGYTSKTCSHCGSRNTERPILSKFRCLDCGYQLHSDLNGARNIALRYIPAQCATSQSCAP